MIGAALFDRLFLLWDRLDRLPLLIRAPIYGATIVWFMIGIRGGLIGIPLIVLYIAIASHTPGTDLLNVATVFGLATLGGTFAGSSYALIGRWLRRLPLGAYLAGIITTAPYMAAALLIVRLAENQPLFHLPDQEDFFAFAICTLLFGLILGHQLFRDP